MGPATTPRVARTLGVAALAVAFLAGCTSHTESGDARLPQAASWSSVTGGPSNSGRAHGSVSQTPELLWSRTLGAPAIGVASSDGIGSSFQATISERGCNLFSLSADDGRKRWCTRLPTDGPRITATVDGRGSLFVPMFGGVGAVASEGENRWFLPTRGTPTTVTLLNNRHLLVISHQGAAKVVNAHTGLDASPELRLAGRIGTDDRGYGLPWCGIGERGCPVPGPAAVDTSSATAYVTVWTPDADEPELVAVRYNADDSAAVDGALDVLWRAPLADGRLGVPAVLSNDRNEVYVHSRDGDLAAYSAVDGSRLWSVPVGYRPDLPPALLPDGTLVTGGRTTTMWKGTDDDHDDDAGPSPVVAVRGEDGSGRELWRRDDLQQLTNPAATEDGRVLVAVRTDGVEDVPGIAVHVLDGGSGETLHRIEVPAAGGPVSGLSIDSDGRIMLTTGLGAVYVFD
ncbi:PQQ-binding-like beta-propeller repeat protein [Dietzia aurantiaca]|uniref:PQQ-binding-like beta-propeller repeat protein n=1 Tax=Dietzia aurantiaca TaxID=983873 RepID=A0ABV9PQJ3_9ACTN